MFFDMVHLREYVSRNSLQVVFHLSQKYGQVLGEIIPVSDSQKCGLVLLGVGSLVRTIGRMMVSNH